MIISQGGHFRLRFTNRTEMEGFQGTSLSTSLLAPAKLVESKSTDLLTPASVFSPLPNALRSRVSQRALSGDSGPDFGTGGRGFTFLGPSQPMGHCQRLRDDPRGNDDGQQCPPLGKQKAEPAGLMAPALCSVPQPGMTAFLCRTHGRRGQRSSCLGLMVPREEEERVPVATGGPFPVPLSGSCWQTQSSYTPTPYSSPRHGPLQPWWDYQVGEVGPKEKISVLAHART